MKLKIRKKAEIEQEKQQAAQQKEKTSLRKIAMDELLEELTSDRQPDLSAVKSRIEQKKADT